MKIDFSQVVTVAGVAVYLDQDKVATLGQLCREALNSQPETRLSLEEMVERGRLAAKIGGEGEAEVTPEEAALIRRCLPDRFQHAELVVTIYDALG